MKMWYGLEKVKTQLKYGMSGNYYIFGMSEIVIHIFDNSDIFIYPEYYFTARGHLVISYLKPLFVPLFSGQS